MTHDPRNEPPFEDSRDYVQSLARGLAVLRTFDADHARLSLADIASRTQLSRAAARRLVMTLQHLGYVRVAMPLQDIQNRLDQLRRVLAAVMLTAAAVATALAVWIASSTTRPLRQLSQAVGQFARSEEHTS